MINLKTLLAILFLPLLIFIFSVNSHKASAFQFNLFNRACNGNSVNGGNGNNSSVCEANNNAGGSNENNNVVLQTLNEIVNIIAAIAGAVAVLIIVIAGFTYTTAGGNSDDTKNARNRIIYTAVGLVIIMFSWTIAHFVLSQVL